MRRSNVFTDPSEYAETERIVSLVLEDVRNIFDQVERDEYARIIITIARASDKAKGIYDIELEVGCIVYKGDHKTPGEFLRTTRNTGRDPVDIWKRGPYSIGGKRIDGMSLDEFMGLIRSKVTQSVVMSPCGSFRREFLPDPKRAREMIAARIRHLPEDAIGFAFLQEPQPQQLFCNNCHAWQEGSTGCTDDTCKGFERDRHRHCMQCGYLLDKRPIPFGMLSREYLST